jgi:hypothetical protein
MFREVYVLAPSTYYGLHHGFYQTTAIESVSSGLWSASDGVLLV